MNQNTTPQPRQGVPLSEVAGMIRELNRIFVIVLLFVTFVAYALGLIVGVAAGRQERDERYKSLQAERPAETQRP